MTLNRRTPLMFLAAPIASALVAPSADAAPAKDCKPRGSVTVKATKKVRVYTRENERRGWQKLYACRRSNNRAVTIATRYPDGEGYPFVEWDEDLLRIRG